MKAADGRFGCDSYMNTPAEVCSVWFALTARNRLDISVSFARSRHEMGLISRPLSGTRAPFYGKVGSAVGLKSLSVSGLNAKPFAISNCDNVVIENNKFVELKK